MKKRFKNYFINLLMPSFVFGSITGVFTAVVICLYKLCAGYIIDLSKQGYQILRGAPLWILALIPVLAAAAWIFGKIYHNHPNLRGGGIPTTVGVLRGILPISSWGNLFGVFAMSLGTFLIGVPLGNEGPSVQMGTTVGKGCVRLFAKKHWAWERYSMTGGACAGFSVATGAPISGILFSVEEAHQRVSPMLLTVSATSVMFAEFMTELLSLFLPIHTTLFPKLSLVKLGLRDVWLPLVIGIVVGLFAVLFLKYYRAISRLNKRLKGKISNTCFIFLVFVVTVFLGMLSNAFISTGHDLILSLFEGSKAIWILVVILLVRATVTLFANTSNITGGLFVPILALGAIFSSVIGESLMLLGLDESYGVIILVLGITACVSSMMKMPLTAIVFAVEALSCYDNILYVIVVAAVSYVITEFFGVKSINDKVIEHREEMIHRGKEAKVSEAFVTVKQGSFAEGKQTRDILWPNNLFVLSVKFSSNAHVEVDEHGGKEIRAGDVLHVRYLTYDPEKTLEELYAIVGEQSSDGIKIIDHKTVD